MIEIRIGVADSPREIALEVDDKPEDVRAMIDGALSTDTKILWITDRRGKQVGLPSTKITYVEIDPEPGARAVGFGAA